MSDKIKIFEVGGSIRNELLGLNPSDRDFAVLAPSYNDMREHLLARGATIYQERPQYVNIKAKLPELGSVDFTLARKESFYTDGRHPDTVNPAETIEEDLARRDFRMNAIAREVGTTDLIDPFEGQVDIRNRVIQSVGDPIVRFTEDKLRMFRAIRFACQLDFLIHGSVLEAMCGFNVQDFAGVSPERVQVELWKAFSANTQSAFWWLSKYPLLFNVMVNKGMRLKPTLER